MSEQLYHEIGHQLSEQHGVSSGQMFGKPCLKIANKAFAAFFNGEMVFKLGLEEVNLLKTKFIASQNWDPSGKKRPMKDWLQVPIEFNEYWSELALQALMYIIKTNKIDN